ncbi:unnamed protein product [Hermetia illucens]|uniref:Uncharacterized protein n=1 Tax=Hermetia illucens TaxID=343691 RepID=A0A7R8UNH7_HERIL|nr:unnamed protein product [Hermetia illucens]
MSSNIDLAINFHLGKVQELKSIKFEVENLERNALGFVCHQNDGKYEDLITGDDVLNCLERVNKKIQMNEERILQLHIHKVDQNLSAMCSFQEDHPEYPNGNVSHLMGLRSSTNELARNSTWEQSGNATERSSRDYFRHSFEADRTRFLSPPSPLRNCYNFTWPSYERQVRPVRQRASYRDSGHFVSLSAWNRHKLASPNKLEI